MSLAEILRRSLASLVLVAIGLGLGPLACSSEEPSSEPCGGACPDGEVCLAGGCRGECDSQSDCSGDESCVRWRFEDGSEAQYCAPLEGRFVACDGDAECDEAAGFRCVSGECRVSCTTHFECSGVGYCGIVDGERTCVRDAPAQPGGYYAGCPNGDECSAEFACISAGPGDLDAYCTTDCASDDDCPRGFECGSIAAVPCARACNVAGDPSRADCAPVEEVGPGLRYDCGAVGVVRRVCEKREFCGSCERDEDCLAVAGQICARDESGDKICTVPCEPGPDACPWGNAASCGVWDSELDVATCSHRFGSCRGTGRGCEPCVQDADCGSTGFCGRFSFTGERFCIDLSVGCDCGEDVTAAGSCLGHGCPDTPGGLEMICFASRGLGDPIGDRCIGASSSTSLLASSPQAGCWPEP